MTDNTFDQYEYVAVITPGATFLLGLSIEWPQYLHMASDKEVSVGELGIFLILAYIAGQVLQSIGEILGWMFWRCFGGLPTNWVLKPNNWLIADVQRAGLETRIKAMPGNDKFDMGAVQDNDWYAITRQIYAKVSQAGRATRIDAFNRTYGLMRGFMVALLALAIVFWMFDPGRPWLAIAAVVLALLALLRLFLSGKDYGRELFVQFLSLPAE